MALTNPVAIYNATTNTEAQLLAHMLGQAGIEAHVTEDLSLAGLWWGGTIPSIHTPKVWVDQADSEAAVPVLQEYERKRHEQAQIEQATPAATGPVTATCPECGQTSGFPVKARGTVQNCPHCRAYMDVGEDDTTGDWGTPDDNTDEPPVGDADR
jgi:Putative prokaryotic signal transducing protein